MSPTRKGVPQLTTCPNCDTPLYLISWGQGLADDQTLDAAIHQSRRAMHAAWTELRGYTAAAVQDGGTIDPATLADYLDELNRRVTAPIHAAMRVDP